MHKRRDRSGIPTRDVVGAPGLPLLFSPSREQLHHLGISVLQHPEIFLHHDVHLSVPPRVDEGLNLDVFGLVFFHDAAARAGVLAEGLELQLALPSVLEAGVQAPSPALDLREAVRGAARSGRRCPLRPLCPRRLEASAVPGPTRAHHAHMLQGVQRVLHVGGRRRQRCDHYGAVLAVSEAGLQKVGQAGAPEGDVLKFVEVALILPLPVSVHDASALLQHQQGVIDVTSSLGHLPRVLCRLKVALGTS
mmetsp:Transcript_47769/g.153865  ORF Transcript_47769/g.153865 Transcript_47769/m.153865 type:complete len:249 (+) Transcript_47769:574-1320(+)